MANFYVSNVSFESTGNNVLSYSANTIALKVGGAEIFTANVSGIVVNTNIYFPQKQYTYISNATATVANSFVVTGAVLLNGNVTPTAIAANTADFAPGIGNVYNIRVSSNTNVVNSEFMITGMTAGTNGQIVILNNIGAMGITIRNEEAGSNGAVIPGVNTPGSTAANRFNMPNHFKLQGYQSAMFYYDGILARWRLTDSISVPFDHKKALTKGFFNGGYSPAAPTIVATADRTTYSTESTAAVPGANLSQARALAGAAGNACKGFINGGTIGPSASAVSDRTVYSTEVTSASPSSNLPSARSYLSASGNSCKGFFSGGVTPAGNPALTTADRSTYSTETTAAVPGANLSQARLSGGAAGNQVKGFFSSGGSSFTSPFSVVTTADRTTYSTETTAAVTGANLSQARLVIYAAGNDCKGFFSGGCSPAFVTTTDRTTYSTETNAAVAGANLSQARGATAAAGNSCKGFFSGGVSQLTPTVTSRATADRTTYSTETTAAVLGANLSAVRYSLNAI